MSKLAGKLMVKAMTAKTKALKALKNEKGETNLIAIILILAVVLVLVLLFKDYLKQIFDNIWGDINKDVSSALS